MTKVLPAIIPINKAQLTEEIGKVAYFADLVQVDISDGVFTNTRTWPYNGQDRDYFEKLKTEEEGWPKWEDTDVELHLMVKNPEEVLSEWIATGVSSIVCHIEATDNFQEVVDMCREKGVLIGIAIKPNTEIERIENFVPQTDFIQVMGSDLLGKHGVNLEEKSLVMIKSLRMKFPNSIIAIDIGVTLDNAETLVDSGVNKIISGGTILNASNPKEVFDYLESL